MGIIIQSAGHSLWEPSLRVGRCFIAQVRSLEELLDTQSGVGPILSDEVDIDLAAFENFLQICLDKIERTNNGELFALMMGCLQVCIALNWKMGGKLPPLSPKLQPLLEGVGAMQKTTWRVTSLKSPEEEIEGRTREVRDTRDWTVYRRE